MKLNKECHICINTTLQFMGITLHTRTPCILQDWPHFYGVHGTQVHTHIVYCTAMNTSLSSAVRFTAYRLHFYTVKPTLLWFAWPATVHQNIHTYTYIQYNYLRIVYI